MSETSSGIEEQQRLVWHIRWHHFVGKNFDLTLTPLGLKVLLEDLTLSEPPRVDIVILRREQREWTAEQYAFLPDGIRQSRAKHILIEHKQTEALNLKALMQALVYDHLYPQGHKLKAEEVQTFVLSAQTPRRATLQEYGFKQGESAGVYRSDNPFARRLIVISLNELKPTLNNAFVQCFASRKRVREAAFQRLVAMGGERMSDAFWDFLLGLRQQWEAKGGEMTNKVEERELTPEMVMETGRKLRKIWLENLTPEDLATLPLEKRLAGLAPEERLAGLAPEERLAGLAPEERLAALAPEEVEQLVEKVPAEKRLAGLAPEEVEQVVEKVPPEKRLVGLTKEEMQKLLAQIEAFLQQPDAIDK